MMEKYLKNKTIMSVAGIVIGLILMIWRGQFVEQMIRVSGYVLLVAAAVYLVMYFRDNRQNEAQMGYAVMAAGAGLLMILLSRTLLRIFPVIAGVVMIVSSAATLMRTYRDSNVPLYAKLLSALVILIGILIVLHPGRIADTIVFCVGAAFVVNGISGLITSRQF